MDLQIDVARGAIDGDEGVAFPPLQRGQMLEIDVDKSHRGLLEDADSGLVRFSSLAEAMALETAMDGAARELAVHTAAHHFDDVVEWQLQLYSQLADQCFFHCG